VDAALPFIILPSSSTALSLAKPLPDAVQLAQDYAFLLVPLIMWASGNYCLDSKNGFNVFPGFPYFKRVVMCSLISGDAECRKADLKIVRDWTMDQRPPKNTSSHWWFSKLPTEVKGAFDRCAKSSLINSAFRTIFSEKHVREIFDFVFFYS